jgi:hypothetical protein
MMRWDSSNYAGVVTELLEAQRSCLIDFLAPKTEEESEDEGEEKCVLALKYAFLSAQRTIYCAVDGHEAETGGNKAGRLHRLQTCLLLRSFEFTVA